MQECVHGESPLRRIKSVNAIPLVGSIRNVESVSGFHVQRHDSTRSFLRTLRQSYRTWLTIRCA